jgi:hypothetical protein
LQCLLRCATIGHPQSLPAGVLAPSDAIRPGQQKDQDDERELNSDCDASLLLLVEASNFVNSNIWRRLLSQTGRSVATAPKMAQPAE